MDIEQVAEMARAVAALPQDQRDYFDGIVADEQAATRREERIAKLRAMSDEDAVKAALMNMCDSIRWREVEFPKFMQDLEDAGFSRPIDVSDAFETVDRVLRVIIALDRQGGPYPHEIPALRNDLYFALDRLTGEDHSGNSPSLPPPPRRLVGRDVIRALRGELAKGVVPPTWVAA